VNDSQVVPLILSRPLVLYSRLCPSYYTSCLFNDYNAIPPVLPRLLAQVWPGLNRTRLILSIRPSGFTRGTLILPKDHMISLRLAGATVRSLPKIPHCCQGGTLSLRFLWLLLSIIGKGSYYHALLPNTKNLLSIA